MAIDKSIIPVPGMIVLNGNGEERTIREVHKGHEDNCPGKTYGISSDHVWFTTDTHMNFKDFYVMCTFISTPEISRTITPENRLNLIFK